MLFSNDYIRTEKFSVRFHILVIAFVFSMFLLILRGNLLSCLLGWDGLGVSSYLLVIYYYNPKAYNAGIVTAITNRLGDAFFLLSIGILACSIRWKFTETFKGTHTHLLNYVIMILILAAITKRAQLPFSSWLPAAIAAPTPVSSLVHSSTLVTAGVYLTFRFSGALSPRVIEFLLIVGLSTSVIAGLSALLEIDIKKIVALSTLRQLGVIIASLGANLPEIAFFHLLAHAYFKALLFLAVGSCISQVSGLQDLRIASLVRQFSPLAACILLRCSAGLCGLPFIGGFYSKDLLIEIVRQSSNNLGIKTLVWVSLFSTPIYSVRLILYLLSARNRSSALQPYLDGTASTTRALMIIAPWAIVGPALVQWLVLNFKFSPRINVEQKIFILIRVMFGIIVGLIIRQLSPFKYGSLFSSSLGSLISLSIVTTRVGAFCSLPIRRVERTIIDQFSSNLLFIKTPTRFLQNGSSYLPKNTTMLKFAILRTCATIILIGWVYLYLPNLLGSN